MARIYRQTTATRVINRVFTVLTWLGMGASYRHVLSVRGRKTGRLRTTLPPVVADAARVVLIRAVPGGLR